MTQESQFIHAGDMLLSKKCAVCANVFRLYRAGETRISGGMLTFENLTKNENNTAVMLVATDGESQDNVTAARDRLLEKDWIIYAVGA